MPSRAVPIGPGPESIAISLYAADPDAARWDRSTWDGAGWASPAWQSVGCQIGEATYRSGAASESGVLSVAAAGQLDLSTIDPLRVLDPLNTQSPYYGYVRPGTPVQLVGLAPGSIVAWTGALDDASHDLASGRGRLRAIDGLAYLAQAQVPDGAVLPNTLRARVRSIVSLVGLSTIVPVEPEVADADPDPAVAAFDGKSAPAWQAITDAALDALYYVWLDPSGVLRFRSWGGFPDAAISIGCPPPDADPADAWLTGLSTIEASAGADAIRNSVRAWASANTFAAAVVDPVSVNRYGVRPLDVQRIVPARDIWAGRILADRADAGLEVAIGELRPYSVAELGELLTALQLGPSIVRLRDDEHGDPIDLDTGLIGAKVGITPSGWRFELVTMISRVDWEAVTPEPPEPPIPPPDPWHTETRTYVASSDALIALTSGGAKYGAGGSNSLPIGVWQGWQYRGLLKFPSIPWTKVRALRSATLSLRTTTQIRVGFGSSPKTQIRRITTGWNAGTASSPGSNGGAVVWPGPSTTGSGAVTSSLPGGQNADKDIRVDALVRAWAPSSIGGSGATAQGLALYEASGSGSNTSEVWPVEQGGAARPVLTLVVEVFD